MRPRIGELIREECNGAQRNLSEKGYGICRVSKYARKATAPETRHTIKFVNKISVPYTRPRWVLTDVSGKQTYYS